MNTKPSDKPSTTIKPLHSATSSNSWELESWQGRRKSAFQPYKQTAGTVLTNLQRGNTQADTPVPEDANFSFHTRAGRGEITDEDVRNETYIDVEDEDGLTALHWACFYGQLTAVQKLIVAGAQVNKFGIEGETPILLAASGGHHEIIRLLLNAGALVNHTDDVGNSALMYAAAGNHPHSCNELLKSGANITLKNHCDQTAFNISVDHKSYLAQAVIENFILCLLEGS